MREELWIIESCCLSPIRRNSVLEELRVRRFAVIQEEMCCRAFCKWLILEWNSDGWNERKSCVSSAYKWWFKDIDEIRVLSGVFPSQSSKSSNSMYSNSATRWLPKYHPSLVTRHLTSPESFDSSTMKMNESRRFSVIHSQAAFKLFHRVNSYTFRHYFNTLLRRRPTALLVGKL